MSASEQRPAKGFFGYAPECEEAVFEFQRKEYPQRCPESIAPKWRWMFVTAAARLGVEPPVWLYFKGGAVVAHQGAIPVRLQVRDQELNTGWFVETMAAQSIRGSPIGPMLIKKALEEMPLNLSLGQTEQMRKLQFALGWREVRSLSNRVFVSGYRMNLRHKLPAVVAETVAFGLGLWHNLRLWWKRSTSRSAWQVCLIDRFTEEHDHLWRRMAQTCVCAVVRDSSYLNWKYVDRPFARFTCLELRQGGELVGASVLMIREPDDAYNYRRGFIVDLVVPLNQDGHVSRLFQESVAVLKQQRAQTVTCHTSSAAVDAAADSIGCVVREAKYHFLVSASTVSEEVKKDMLSPDGWFLTLGDSDADAYAD